MGLGFLSPLFLIGLAAAAVPILIHLFRRQPDPVVPFSAVRFLHRAPAEQARRRRLREWVLLALRTAALALLALSFARPYFAETSAESAAPVHVVAVDASYSVSTPRQVTRARELAAEAVHSAPQDHLVAVVRFDELAEVMVRPTADRARAVAAVRSLEPGQRGTRYAAALSAASELTARAGGSLVIVSDLQRVGWSADAAAVPRGLQVEARDVGTPASNLSVTSLLRTREGAAIGLRNSGHTGRPARVALAIDDRVVAEQGVTVPARGSVDVTVRASLPARGGMTARVTDGDEGYAADNVRVAVLDPPVRPRVLVIAGGSSAPGTDAFYLERAVAAAEGPAGLMLERITAERSGAPDALRDAAAIVLLASAGLDRRAADAIAAAVAQGAGLFVVAGPSLELPRVAAQLPEALGVRAGRVEQPQDAVTFAPADVRHPVFRAFAREPGLLGAARFHRLIRWDSRQARTLARFSNGAPALVEVEGAQGRVLHFASDIANAWNDFALHPAFVPFVHDVIRYLVSGRAPLGEYLVGALPGDAGQRPGVVTVPGGPGDQGRSVAVNVDLREADPARLSPDAFVAAVPRTVDAAEPPVRSAARQRESEQSLWRYGLMLMLVGLAAESVVGRRS